MAAPQVEVSGAIVAPRDNHVMVVRQLQSIGNRALPQLAGTLVHVGD
jgi:hypothetical protein